MSTSTKNSVTAPWRDPRGSLWRKWDLHVHTPASLVSQYGGESEEVWNRYIASLAALPEEIAVLGINDYIFLDGYKRVRKAWEDGQLPNIRLLLPVIELRIDKFAGTDGAFKRVNYHIIFSDQVPVEAIEEQFIPSIKAKYQLRPDVGAVPWGASPTKHSLTDLGKKIIESAPKDQRHRFGAPLLEGFNNFNVSLESVEDALQSHFFKDHHITAVGKTEWASIKWQDGSIAEKKSVINNASLVFVAAEDAAAANNTRAVLRQHGVNARLLDCSDAHDFAESNHKDRLGNCCTWIKADPTFEGLRHVLHEPEHRIYLGDTPPQIGRARQAPTRLIDRVTFRKTPTSKLAERWFDGVDVPLNPGLVAIIGRKGSGKSALLDAIGLAGDSMRQEHSSFLKRFCRPEDNKGDSFEVELQWLAGNSGWRSLGSSSNTGAAIERVTYIPQHLFEKICNELQGESRGLFDLELKRVIFSHVSEPRKLGLATADEWLGFMARELGVSRADYRSQLSKINEQIVALEAAIAPANRERAQARVRQLEFELDLLMQQKPEEVKPPSEEQSPESIKITHEIAELQDLLQSAQRELSEVGGAAAEAVARAAAARRLQERVDRLVRAVETARHESGPDLERLGLQFEEVVNVSVKRDLLEQSIANGEADAAKYALQQLPETQGSPAARLLELEAAIASRQTMLDEPHRVYHEYLQRLSEWQGRRDSLVGDVGTPETLAFAQADVVRIDALPAVIEAARTARREIARSVLSTLTSEVSLLQELYAPIQRAIGENEIAKANIDLGFTAEIHDAGFTERFLEFIHQGRVGSFNGREEGEKRVRETMAKHPVATVDGALAFAEEVLSLLKADHRDAKRPEVDVQDQLRASRTPEELYDFLFGFTYLEPRYGMRFGGRPLEELSPGEKGALLLVFYLLLDQADTPLLLDQPEENLDNETVFGLLVPAVKAAKDRRQVIVVTHNPNLAIACDADQVVCASRSADKNSEIAYLTGAIENPLTNKRAVDVLEGTMPAFLNRSWKYHEGSLT